jgi:alanine racemase
MRAEGLRAAGIDAPIHIVGPVAAFQAARVVAADVRLVVYDADLVEAVAAAARARPGGVVPLHVKVETGNHRQGLDLPEALALGTRIAMTEGVRLEGLATHYADIEDTTDHRFAMAQVGAFEEALGAFRAAGLEVPMPSTANSAATILWPRTHGALARVGIAAYGLWPSTETYAAALALPAERDGRGGFLPELRPALSWRARIAQVKTVKAGAWIGYGRTYRCTHATRIAIVPVGYHEGYDRRLSNLAHMLVDGVRAPVRGRVCMNMAMIDVSDAPGAVVGSVVTLLGEDGGPGPDGERVVEKDISRGPGALGRDHQLRGREPHPPGGAPGRGRLSSLEFVPRDRATPVEGRITSPHTLIPGGLDGVRSGLTPLRARVSWPPPSRSPLERPDLGIPLSAAPPDHTRRTRRPQGSRSAVAQEPRSPRRHVAVDRDGGFGRARLVPRQALRRPLRELAVGA